MVHIRKIWYGVLVTYASGAAECACVKLEACRTRGSVVQEETVGPASGFEPPFVLTLGCTGAPGVRMKIEGVKGLML